MSNFPCPECGVTLLHASKSCGCGWGRSAGRRLISNSQPVNAEQHSARMQREAEFSRECRQWLDDNHITKPDMTQSQRMKAMAAYRNRLKFTLRKTECEPKAWANSIKTSYVSGDDLLPMQISMAADALNEVWSNRECKPRATA